MIYVRIDRRRKVPATVLLRCLPAAEDEKKFAADPRKPTIRGMSDTEILSTFYSRIPLKFDGKMWAGATSAFAGLDKYRLKKVLAAKGDRLNAKRMAKITASTKEFGIMPESLIGEYLFDPIMSGDEVVFQSGTEITEEVLADLDKMGVKEISLIAIDNTTITSHMRNTLVADKTTNREEALIEILSACVDRRRISFHLRRPASNATALLDIFQQAEIENPTAVFWDNTCGICNWVASDFGFFGCCENNTLGTMHLGNDNTFHTRRDETAAFGHQWHFAHKYFLFFYFSCFIIK